MISEFSIVCIQWLSRPVLEIGTTKHITLLLFLFRAVFWKHTAGHPISLQKFVYMYVGSIFYQVLSSCLGRDQFSTGGAHYVKHLDNDVTDSNTRLGPPGQRICDREITAIVYLNENWNDDVDGGMLRLYPSTTEETPQPPPIDIAPEAGRIVLFQSRLVEHEVLPAFRERWALSAWIPGMSSFVDQ